MKSGQTAGVINGKSVAEIFLCLRNAALAHVFHRRASDEIIRNSIDDIPESRYNGSNKKNSLQKVCFNKINFGKGRNPSPVNATYSMCTIGNSDYTAELF